MDDSDGRAYELQQAAVKCMRGILFCYMRQADKVSFHVKDFFVVWMIIIFMPESIPWYLYSMLPMWCRFFDIFFDTIQSNNNYYCRSFMKSVIIITFTIIVKVIILIIIYNNLF